MTKEEADRLVASVRHWHHTFDIVPGVRTPGSYDPAILWDRIKGVCDWRGARVLDIGPADGAVSMWAAKSGAEVTALDFRPKTATGFAAMEKITGLTFDFHVGNILDPPNLGTFDAVFFLGVLYHLPDPLRGLWACRRYCKTGARLFVKSWFSDTTPGDEPLMKYIRHGATADWTNFWAPNRCALLAMMSDVAFDVVRHDAWGSRIFVEAIAVEDAERGRRMSVAYAQNIAGR